MHIIHMVNTGVVTAGLDLNLLAVLDAVLSERNVTAAGRRVGLSQPATSSALRRLRAHFEDPLLVRVPGGAYQLTPLAESLSEQLQPLMEATSRLTASRASTTIADREFSIVMVDCDAQVLGPLIMDELNRTSPLATLRIDSATVAIRQNTVQKLRLVDGSMVPHRLLDGMPYLDLYEERWVCVADRENSLIWEGMATEDLHGLPWVAAFDRPPYVFSAMQALREAGIVANVAVHTEAFLPIGALLRGTQRVALMPSRTAVGMGENFQYVSCPVLPLPFSMAFAWHPIHEREAQHRELRDRLVDAARRVPPMG
jgi:DNA-binding transcriptional LysR family regulator